MHVYYKQLLACEAGDVSTQVPTMCRDQVSAFVGSHVDIHAALASGTQGCCTGQYDSWHACEDGNTGQPTVCPSRVISLLAGQSLK